MPTSIAHALGGLAAAQANPLARRWSRARVLVFCAVLANLPDADFLPGVLVGDASRFHRQGTHTLLATLVVALACALWLRWRSGAQPGDAARFGTLAFIVYGSHLALDMLVTRATVTAGVPLFWPVDPARYYTILHLPRPFAWLLDLDFDKHGAFFHELLSPHGALVFLGHGLLFAPLPIAAWLIRRGFETWRGTDADPDGRRPRPGFAPEPEPAGED